MTSIVAYTIASQTNYHIIIFVCCSLLIVIILHMLCIVFEHVEHGDPSEHGEPCEHIFTERVNPIINFNTVKSHNRKKQSTMLTDNKCNALKRNGSSCRQDGNKSGGKIINGYCVYHKKMRK